LENNAFRLTMKKLSPPTIETLVAQALAIEQAEADTAGALGFMARAMTLASLPHSKVSGVEFKRTNGNFTLSIMSPSDVGIPYGSIPRLLLAWLTTEAVKTKSRELLLGDSMSAFMRELGIEVTGGPRGGITRLKRQSIMLFSSTINAIWRDGSGIGIRGHKIADRSVLWWDAKDPRQGTLWQSSVTLSEAFYSEITERPIPVDTRALRALKRSPMALDVYTWLTYRMSYLKKPTMIPWEALQVQFGSDYPTTSQGRRDFRKGFLHALRKVTEVYPAGRADGGSDGLTLAPGRPHIHKLK
jgi:hypothetical protein